MPTINIQFRRRARSARALAALASCAGLAALIGSAGVLSSAKAASVRLPTVKILEDAGFTGDTPIWVAMERGFFRKNGINAVLVPSTGVGDLPKMVAGVADVDVAPPTLAVAGAASGEKLSILGTVVHVYDQQLVGKTSLLPPGVKPGEFPQVMRALKGQTVCINAAGGSNDVMFRFLMAEAGVPISDVTIDYTGSLQTVVAAYQGGRCSVAHVPEPGPLELTSQPGSSILLNLSKGQGPKAVQQPFLTIIVRKAWDAQHRVLGQRLTDALDEAVSFMTQRKHHAAVVRIMEKDVLQGLTPSLIPGIVSDTLNTLSAKPADLAFTPADLKKAEDLVADTGMVTKPSAAYIPATKLIPGITKK